MPIIRHEIQVVGENAASDFNTLGTHGYVQFPSANYSGTCTVYLEANISTAAGNLSLRRKGTTTDDCTITVSGTGRLRSAGFTADGTTTYEWGLFATNGNIRMNPGCARVIVIQNTGSSAVTGSQSQFEIGGDPSLNPTSSTTAVAIGSTPPCWKYTSANWNGTVTFDAEASYKTAGSNTATITLQEDDGSFGSWADKITIVSAVSNTSMTRTRTSAHFTPTDGRHYRIAYKSSSTKSSVSIGPCKVIVNQTSTITKLEEMYLFPCASSGVGTVAASNNLWDSTEWVTCTNTYKYFHIGSAGTSSSKLIDADNGNAAVDAVNAVAVGANEVIAGSSFSMPTSGHQLDISATVGAVPVGGVIVAVVISSLQSITGVSRIKATATKTQTGVSRVKVHSTQTQTGVSKLVSRATKTQTGKSNIRGTSSQTQTGKSRVKVHSTQTQTGKSRVKVHSTQTQTGVSRVRATATKTQTGKSRVRATSSQTQTGKSRIKVHSTATQTGVSNIRASSTKTQTGKSRISATATKTQTGKSRIKIHSTQTITGTSRIRASSSQTQTGVSRIRATGTQTVTGVSRIRATASHTQTGVSKIRSASTQQTQDGVSRINKTVDSTQTGVSRIRESTTETQLGVSRVRGATTQTILGVSRLRVTPLQTQLGVSRIQEAFDQTMLGTSRIRASSAQTIFGKSRIEALSSQTQLGTSRIKTTGTQTQTGVSRIRVIHGMPGMLPLMGMGM